MAANGNHHEALAFAAGPGAVAEALGVAHAFLSATDADEDMQARVAIIVEELVINVIEHGGVAAGDPIALSLTAGAEGVRLVLEDGGAHFDPREARQEGDLPPERGGGAGIALMLAWSRVVDYARMGARNRLELLIPYAC